MAGSPLRRCWRGFSPRLVLVCSLVISAWYFSLSAQSQQTQLVPLAGPNVNMVSGTEPFTGDPYLQRQNEPSIAVSTRNAQHILAGDNDYRTVDIPGIFNPGEEPVADSWLGL